MAAMLPYILAIGGSLIEQASNRDVSDRQKKIIEAMRQYQTGKALQGEAAISKYLPTIAPDALAKERAASTDELAQGLKKSVDTTRAYETPQNFAGKVSESYKQRAASDTASVNDRISRAIQQLSVIGSPENQQQQIATRFGRTAGDVDSANTAIRNVVPAYEGAIGRVRPNYWDTFFSQALKGSGQAAASRGAARPNVNPGDLGYYW